MTHTLTPQKAIRFKPNENGRYLGLMEACRKGELMTLHAFLRQEGEPLTREDFFGPGLCGEAAVFLTPVMLCLGDILEILHENGEQVTLRDFTELKDSKGKTLQYLLLDKNLFTKLMDARHWSGHYHTLEELGFSLSPSLQEHISLHYLLTETRNQAGLPIAETLPAFPLQELLTEDTYGHLLLEYRYALAQLETIAAWRAAKGEPFTKALLMKTRTKEGQTLFARAAACGAAEAIVNILLEEGETLSPQELVSSLTAEWHPSLAAFFTPRLWVGRLVEMMEAYEALPPATQTRFPDFSFRFTEASILSVQRRTEHARARYSL